MSENTTVERIYQLTVRATLVASAVLVLITIGTAVSVGAPNILLWGVLAAAVGAYSRPRLGAVGNRRVGADTVAVFQTKSSATSS
ncbi:hypothetical protein BH23ACT5_BH23ACT5_09300 [soil metagenome]